MLGFLYRLLVGRFTECKHEWEIIDINNYGRNNKIKGFLYALQCKKCGDVESRDITV